METVICPNCLEQTDRRLERRREIYPVRGVPIEVNADVESCIQCGTEIANPELEDAALTRAYDLYRKLYGTIRPEEIRKLREKYGLSQRSFARLLDWGVVSVHRYETGALPDSVHSDLLVALQDDLAMDDFLKRHKDRLRPREAKRALEVASAARAVSLPAILARVVQEKMDTFPDLARGNRNFELERLAQMMIFFARPAGAVLTKLLKLLWYADFLAYKRLTVSLSGAVYSHHRFGPVPQEYDQLLAHAKREGFLRAEIESFTTEEGIREGTIFYAAMEFDSSLFNTEELAVLETVQAHFADKHAKATVRATHAEHAWLDTPERAVITYDRALDLSID
jgi:putative zinc finger/helix-turn-helix YgiT family protein